MTERAPTAEHRDTEARGSEAQRRRRFDWEAERIAEARASIAAGRVVDEAEVDAWLDSLDTEHELPIPNARR